MSRSKTFPGLPVRRRDDKYIPCPHCGTVNFRLRAACRKCGKSLHTQPDPIASKEVGF